MDVRLLDGVFSSTRYPHFFNGRILTATDLNQERDIHLNRSQYLAQALGDGIIDGLCVSLKGDLTLEVSRGSAINCLGEVLYLSATSTVDLESHKSPKADENSKFNACGQVKISSTISNQFYLLAITASKNKISERRAPAAYHSKDRPGWRIHEYEELAIQFKLILLNDVLRDNIFISPATEPRLFRNRLAAVCFGIGKWQDYVSYNEHENQGINLVSILKHWDDNKPPLTDRDVPLAILHIKDKKVVFLDEWAVRRPCVPRMGLEMLRGADQFLTGSKELINLAKAAANPHKNIEATSFLWQFQHHLQDLVTSLPIYTSKHSFTVSDFFEVLPPAGYFPKPDIKSSWLPVRNFFGSMAIQSQVSLNPQYIRRLFYESFYEEPIKCGEEKVHIYEYDSRTIIFIRYRQKGSPLIVQISPSNGIQGETISAILFGHHLADVKEIRFKLKEENSSNFKISTTVLQGGTENWIPVNLKIESEAPLGDYLLAEIKTSNQELGSENINFPVMFEVMPKRNAVAIIEPPAARQGETVKALIHGADLKCVTDKDVAFYDGDGITMRNITPSEDGSRMRLDVEIAQEARIGSRFLLISTTEGTAVGNFYVQEMLRLIKSLRIDRTDMSPGYLYQGQNPLVKSTVVIEGEGLDRASKIVFNTTTSSDFYSVGQSPAIGGELLSYESTSGLEQQSQGIQTEIFSTSNTRVEANVTRVPENILPGKYSFRVSTSHWSIVSPQDVHLVVETPPIPRISRWQHQPPTSPPSGYLISLNVSIKDFGSNATASSRVFKRLTLQGSGLSCFQGAFFPSYVDSPNPLLSISKTQEVSDKHIILLIGIPGYLYTAPPSSGLQEPETSHSLTLRFYRDQSLIETLKIKKI